MAETTQGGIAADVKELRETVAYHNHVGLPVELGAADHDALVRVLDEVERLDALVNSPHTARFLEAVRCEVAHQVERWGTAHDRAKEPQDWFWLVGYLAGKALHAHSHADVDKALHHTISTSAALANWWAAIARADNRMQPGSSDLQQFLRDQFGPAFCD